MQTSAKVHVVETADLIIITAGEGWTEEEWEAAVPEEVLEQLAGDWDYVVEVEEDGTTTDVWIMSKATA